LDERGAVKSTERKAGHDNGQKAASYSEKERRKQLSSTEATDNPEFPQKQNAHQVRMRIAMTRIQLRVLLRTRTRREGDAANEEHLPSCRVSLSSAISICKMVESACGQQVPTPQLINRSIARLIWRRRLTEPSHQQP
jgi:hypothetical protein